MMIQHAAATTTATHGSGMELFIFMFFKPSFRAVRRKSVGQSVSSLLMYITSRVQGR